jgi:hypothetical protein
VHPPHIADLYKTIRVIVAVDEGITDLALYPAHPVLLSPVPVAM